MSLLLNIPRSTVGGIVRRFKNEDRINSVLQTGRPRIVNDQRVGSWLLSKVKGDHRKSAPKLKTGSDTNYGINESAELFTELYFSPTRVNSIFLVVMDACMFGEDQTRTKQQICVPSWFGGVFRL